MDNRIVSYAQNREDIILSAFFINKNKGFYVDIGANDPEVDSVTKYFYDRGWRGINIEPSPALYDLLVKERPRDLNLNIGISDKSGYLSFREYEGHGLSTFSKKTKDDLIKKGHPLTLIYRDYEVRVKRLDEVLDGAKINEIDFMKIDVEGYEYEVILSNNWKKYRPHVICIEANHIQKDWHGILKKNKYKNVFNDGLNDYFVDMNYKSIKFEYIDAVIGRNIIKSTSKIEFEKLDEKNRLYESEIKMLHNNKDELETEISKLNLYIYEKSRLKNLVKDILLKIDIIITQYFTRKTKRRKLYPNININKSDLGTDNILKEIQISDKKVFVSKPTVFQRIEIKIYKYIFIIYKIIKKVIYKVLRYLKRMIRK